MRASCERKMISRFTCANHCLGPLSLDTSGNSWDALEKWVQDSVNDRATLSCGVESELLFIECSSDIFKHDFYG